MKKRKKAYWTRPKMPLPGELHKRVKRRSRCYRDCGLGLPLYRTDDTFPETGNPHRWVISKAVYADGEEWERDGWTVHPLDENRRPYGDGFRARTLERAFEMLEKGNALARAAALDRRQLLRGPYPSEEPDEDA